MRLAAISPTAKLLVLPLLFYHFDRSRHGEWVFIAFLCSCVLIMTMSWLVALVPAMSLKTISRWDHSPRQRESLLKTISIRARN